MTHLTGGEQFTAGVAARNLYLAARSWDAGQAQRGSSYAD